MRVAQYTLYSKSSGLEVRAWERRDAQLCPGRVSLRFFTMGGDNKTIRFILEPHEGFMFFRAAHRIVRDGGRVTLATHRHTTEAGEDVITKVILEKWKNGDNYAIILSRGDTAINVPCSEDMFLYMAELLKHLSVTQAYVTIDAGQTTARQDRAHLHII